MPLDGGRSMGAGASSRSPAPALTRDKLSRLERQFVRLAKGRDAVTITDLQSMPELAGNPMVPRLFQVADIDGDGSLSLAEFLDAAKWLHSMRGPGSLAELAFKVFDLNGDGFIDTQELYIMLQSIVGSGYTSKQLEHVVHATMQQYDSSGDCKLAFTEFAELLQEDELRSKFTLAM